MIDFEIKSMVFLCLSIGNFLFPIFVLFKNTQFIPQFEICLSTSMDTGHTGQMSECVTPPHSIIHTL